MPKSEGTRIDDTHVRTMIGAVLDLDHEDGRYFYVKLYEEPAESAAQAAAMEPAPPAPPAVPPAFTPIASAQGVTISDFGAGLPTSGQWREGFGVGDVNGDGRPDLVFPPARKSPGPPAIYLGDGAGHWKRWREARFPPMSYDYGDAQVADLNGDGIADIALAMHFKGIAVLLGDGKGNFRSGGEGLDFVVPGGGLPSFSARALRLVDWERKGRPDILTIGEGPALGGSRPGTVRVSGIVRYENLGDGRWRRQVGKPQLNPPVATSLAVGDFNGDGRPDLAFATAVLGSTEILAFGTADGGWSIGSVDTLPANGYLRSIAAADFDRDGVEDVVVAAEYEREGVYSPRLDVFLSRDHGKSWAIRPVAIDESVAAVAAGPLREAGSPADIVALTASGKLLIFWGDGRGSFSRLPISVPAVGCSPSSVQLADLDGDGLNEIVSTFGEEGGDEKDRCPSGGRVLALKFSSTQHSH